MDPEMMKYTAAFAAGAGITYYFQFQSDDYVISGLAHNRPVILPAIVGLATAGVYHFSNNKMVGSGMS